MFLLPSDALLVHGHALLAVMHEWRQVARWGTGGRGRRRGGEGRLLTCRGWIIQYIGDFFGTFVDDKLIVCNTSFFFCFECTNLMFGAINRDLCSELLPCLVHSDQTRRSIGFSTFLLSCFVSFLIRHVWVVQCVGHCFVTFVNDESIVCNTGCFFCVEYTNVMWGAINGDLCNVLLPILAHSD